MTGADGPRLATPAEFPEMMALLDRYFAYENGGMRARLPFVYDPERSDRHAVVVEDGRIVSHIAAIPQTLSTGTEGETVECWGIGGVATDRRYRGNGHMSRLLEFWLDRMTERNVALSDLGGNRQRYAHFGYENAGIEYRYSLTERSFDGEPIASDAATVAVDTGGSDEHLEALHRIHEAELYRVVRDPAGSRTVFGQRGLETIVYDDGDEPAYVCLTRESRSPTVEEFGGSEAGLEALLSHLLAVLDLNELTARVPPRHPLEPVFARHSSFWTARPHRKVRICDLPTLLEAFAGQLEARWLESGRTEHGSIELGIEDESDERDERAESVRIAYGPDSVTVEPGTERPDVELERTAMTSLLFGMPDRTADLRTGDPFLETALPLRFFVWASEHV
ncbi:GNAT family N-acetyltransferase [Natronoglomus mannanivorans]|uniref:GNAT family N-acetyltransferase n=1 Tax=Natronoglomus mannanivorans TaxID=2979990 RepID=A0AAP3E320_9EURY|nr:GNAT family N-acetyltransferase [Halobacteria archaeon AArc-xg1-1]